MVFGEKKKGTVTGNANASASGSGSGNGNGVSIGMGGDFRDPKRSVYYHEIFNPLGAPPPGMPYLEKREFRKVVERVVYSLGLPFLSKGDFNALAFSPRKAER